MKLIKLLQQQLFLSLIVLCLSILSACSVFMSEETNSLESSSNPASKIVGSLRFYLSSTLLGVTEFEQYSISGQDLFFECGSINKNTNLAQGSLVAEISSELKEDLALSSLEILGMGALNPAKELQAKKGLAQIEVITIDGKSAKVELSFNQILKGATEFDQKFAVLISKIRKSVGDSGESLPTCYNNHFHGL